MKTISSLFIPEMFTAYAEDLGYKTNGLHHFQYFCEKCDQPFSAAWGKLEYSMSQFERGRYFVCPHCGKRHGEHVVYGKRHEKLPHSVCLTIKEFKNAVTFEISCKTVYFDDYLNLREGGYKEVIKFDIPGQKATFTTYSGYAGRGRKDKVIELGNPLDLDVLDSSILGYFLPFSLANNTKRSELNQLLKTLREIVQNKLEKHLGHKVSGMHVSSGQLHGLFLLPIFNIAYRVTFPDAPNLPKVYREDLKTIQSAMDRKMIDKKMMDQIIQLNRKNRNLVQSILLVNPIPDKPLVRRILNDDPFNFGLLTKAFFLCANYDHAIRMYTALTTIREDIRLRWSLKKDLFNFLRVMKLFYGELGMVRLVENYEDMKTHDCVNLYKQLTKGNRKSIKSESVRLRDLHDWMSLRHKKQTHKNLKFNVPEHIVNRLSMQKEQLKFFLPRESIQLLEAGHELHNCVASYGSAMNDNKKWIVLVANDKGKLTACLEIMGKELVQAKLDKNKPASCDRELNSAIVTWAKEANIKIKTSDIKIPNEKKSDVAVPA